MFVQNVMFQKHHPSGVEWKLSKKSFVRNCMKYPDLYIKIIYLFVCGMGESISQKHGFLCKLGYFMQFLIKIFNFILDPEPFILFNGGGVSDMTLYIGGPRSLKGLFADIVHTFESFSYCHLIHCEIPWETIRMDCFKPILYNTGTYHRGKYVDKMKLGVIS